MLQAFTTWSDEISERLDPFYYSSGIKSFRQKLDKLNTKRLSDLIDGITKGETPLWRGDSYTDEGVPFLKAQNINPEGITGEIAYIPTPVDSRMRRSQLNGGELLYTMAGTIGVATLFPTDYGRANINQAIAKITVKSGIDKEYLVIILNSDICKTQAKILVTAVAQPNINFEQIKSIRIPYMNEDTRNKIIKVYREDKKLIQYKKQKAQELLAGVDDYILDKLGISIDQADSSTTFSVWSDEIENRFDPKYMRSNKAFKDIEPKYKRVKLDDLLLQPPQYGANERAIEGNKKNDIRYIRITDIDENGSLVDDDWKTAEQIENKYLLENNDLLFARSGATAGKSYIHTNEASKAIFAGYLIRFKIDPKKASPNFVFILTKTSYYKLWKDLIQRPSGQPNINSEEFKSFELPLPPIETQNEIVIEVNKRNQEARALLDQINASLKEAKSKIEQMILGA